MDSKILIANNIYKSFGAVQALKNVSFEVAPAQIHCLVGENGSGKSTFVKLIAGVYPPDRGEIIINGYKYTKCTVRDSIREGVQVIYQDLSLFPHMSVAENIATNRLIVQNKRLVDWREIQNIAQEQLDKIGVSIDLKEPVDNISIANRQLVAICRALSMDAKILFMDEPTTALTKHEVNRLISIVLDLKKKGISVVFISHKLNEVMEVADQVAIFRDGEKVGDFPSYEVNEKTLIYYMTGRKVEYSRYVRKNEGEEPVLEVKGFTRKGNYSDVNLKVRKGDILGIIGPMGAGRTELAMTLFGLNPQDSGKIIMEGKECRFTSPDQASKSGISLVPENRQAQGCFMGKSITDNVCSTILEMVSKALGLLDTKLMDNKAQDTVKELRIVTENVSTEVQNLSGGNQQKVVLGKWITTLPKVLILDSPTVGVDVGSREEIYERIQHFAAQGVGIIFISDEISEILANCNELLVMRSGKVVAYLDSADLEAEDSHKRIYEIMYSETMGSN
jgi:simple sugar transport system ATP-binding protein